MKKMHLLAITTAAALVAPVLGALTTPALAQDTRTLTLWSRADNSGPLRPGNILKGAEALNKVLEQEGADYRVAIEVLEQPSEGGYDKDAERLAARLCNRRRTRSFPRCPRVGLRLCR